MKTFSELHKLYAEVDELIHRRHGFIVATAKALLASLETKGYQEEAVGVHGLAEGDEQRGKDELVLYVDPNVSLGFVVFHKFSDGKSALRDLTVQARVSFQFQDKDLVEAQIEGRKFKPAARIDDPSSDVFISNLMDEVTDRWALEVAKFAQTGTKAASKQLIA